MFSGDDKRKSRRYPSIAHVRIPGAFTGDALLKDLSITGCRIECTMHPEVEIRARYKLTVIPEVNSKIGRFDLTTECKWIRTMDYSSSIGFDIVESHKGKSFQRYVDYLSWRAG